MRSCLSTVILFKNENRMKRMKHHWEDGWISRRHFSLSFSRETEPRMTSVRTGSLRKFKEIDILNSFNQIHIQAWPCLILEEIILEPEISMDSYDILSSVFSDIFHFYSYGHPEPGTLSLWILFDSSICVFSSYFVHVFKLLVLSFYFLAQEHMKAFLRNNLVVS